MEKRLSVGRSEALGRIEPRVEPAAAKLVILKFMKVIV